MLGASLVEVVVHEAGETEETAEAEETEEAAEAVEATVVEDTLKNFQACH